MHDAKRQLRVFLCHASADKPKVRELYRYLKRRGIRPWFDEVDLIGGQDWQVEIPKALAISDAIIICLTKNSVDKEGYIQKEIKFALDKALEMPEGRIFLIPVRFEECEVPFLLSRYQWVDLFDEAGYSRMMRALKFRASQLERAPVEVPKAGDAIPKIGPPVEERKPVTAKETPAPVKPDEMHFEPSKAKVERPELKKAKSPRKPNKAIIVALIGFAGTIIAALLGSLIIEEWFSPVSVPTQQATTTITSVYPTTAPSQTIEPGPAPTKAFTLTPTPLPTEITDARGVSMVLVQAGEFIMGSDNGDNNEQPVHNLYLDTYYIDKFVVTNKFYEACVDEDECVQPMRSDSATHSSYYKNPVFDNFPVVYVNWYRAKAYCKWRGARLPTEAEWEKAARGTEARTYPWGENSDRAFANFNGVDTTAVDTYGKGKSIYGAYDMAGNVWQWVSSLYQPYPYKYNDGREDLTVLGARTLRGGSWFSGNYYIRSTNRNKDDPSSALNRYGFRCARTP